MKAYSSVHIREFVRSVISGVAVTLIVGHLLDLVLDGSLRLENSLLYIIIGAIIGTGSFIIEISKQRRPS